MTGEGKRMERDFLKENECIDDLEIRGFKIIQNRSGFCFGMDSVLLSDFAKEIKPHAKCVDLGTGTGILSVLLCAKTNLSEIFGVEIQEEVADMAKRSSLLNHLEDRFKVIHMDIKEIPHQEILEKNSFDCVITNPPYKKMHTGRKSKDEIKLISRHEVAGNLKDFIKTAYYLLKDNGTLYMVHRPERLVDIIQTLRQERLEPKELRFVYPYKNEKPNLILIKAVKYAKEFLIVDKPLIVYEEDGNYTQEILEIYGKEKS